MKLSVSDKIREIRQRKGLSQENIAAKMGILQSTYNKIECGKVKLKFDDALRICKILKVPIEQIVPSESDARVFESHDRRLQDIVILLDREIECLQQIKNSLMEL